MWLLQDEANNKFSDRLKIQYNLFKNYKNISNTCKKVKLIKEVEEKRDNIFIQFLEDTKPESNIN